MIKITKAKSEPNVLKVNKDNWTQELLQDIAKFGSYSKLPDSHKKVINERYKHPAIKNALIPKKDTKCAFCECIPDEGGYIEIEHYLPKSIFPKETYVWTNLLPSCKRCNLKKLAYDTSKFPIIKPDVDDPKEYIEYDSIKMIVKKNSINREIASRTIKKLELNQFRLIKPRSELLVALTDYELNLGKTLEEFKKAKNINKKTRLVNNILSSFDKINNLKNPENKFSGFCTHFIENSEIITSAIAEIDAFNSGISD